MAETTYLVYDADCGFCRRCAEWCRARLVGGVTVVSGADFLSHSGRLSASEVASSVWWVEPDAVYRGAAAVGRTLAATKTPWRHVGRLARRGPLPWLAEPLYRVVVRFRHRLPGCDLSEHVPTSRPGGPQP